MNKKRQIPNAGHWLILCALLLAVALCSAAAAEETQVPLKKIKFTAKTYKISPVDSLNLSIKLTENPLFHTETVTFESSNPAILNVTPSGFATVPEGIRSGSVTVTATSSGGKTAQCKVKIKAVDVKKITLSSKSLRIHPGLSGSLTCKVVPKNATWPEIEWSSSNSAVATVDGEGIVKAVQKGTAIITAKNPDSGKTASCVVTVDRIYVSSVSLNLKKQTVGTGGSFKLKATVKPAGAGNKTVAWSSDNPSVASVDENGKVTGRSAGKTVIRAVSTDGSNRSASCEVTVKEIIPKSVSLSPKVRTLDPGAKVRLSYSTTPSYSSYNGSDFATWTSSDPSVASVSENGEVTAHQSGIAEITLTVGPTGSRISAKGQVRVRSSSPKTVTVGAVGDVILGGDPRGSSQTHAKLKVFRKHLSSYAALGNDPLDYVFRDQALVDELKADDITVANLECALTNEGRHQNEVFLFKGYPSYAAILPRGSIEVCSLANNHNDDFHEKGIQDTKKALAAHGVGAIPERGSCIVTRNGVRVGFFGMRVKGSSKPSVVTQKVSALKEECDVVYVFFHFTCTTKSTWKYGSHERSMAHAAVDAGASVVVGAHPHMLSGIEIYNGAYIAYGLGDMVVGGTNERYNFLFRTKLLVHEGFVEVADPTVVSIYANSSKDRLSNFSPIKLTGSKADACISRIRSRSAQFGTDLSGITFVR